MLPGPISEIVPCSRTFRYGRMQAIILWTGFVWRRGVLGYAFDFFALLRCLRHRLVACADCGFRRRFSPVMSDLTTGPVGLIVYENSQMLLCERAQHSSDLQLRIGVMCVLLNIGCSRRTLEPTSLPHTRPCRGPRLIQRGSSALVERLLRHAQHGNARWRTWFVDVFGQYLLSSASACPSQQEMCR